MTSDRSNGTRRLAGTEVVSVDPIASFVRTHGCAPPYQAVDWRALEARVLTDADTELERRRAQAIHAQHRDAGAGAPAHRRPGLDTPRGSARTLTAPWWAVTAGWARPATAAAAFLLTASLVVTGTDISTRGDGVASPGPAASTGTDGADTLLLGAANGAAFDMEAGSVTGDSLFAAMVDGP